MLARIATLIGAHPADTPADAEAALIVQSGLFDERWYRLTYPDVADFPGGPLAHYLKHGVI